MILIGLLVALSTAFWLVGKVSGVRYDRDAERRQMRRDRRGTD